MIIYHAGGYVKTESSEEFDSKPFVPVVCGAYFSISKEVLVTCTKPNFHEGNHEFLFAWPWEGNHA